MSFPPVLLHYCCLFPYCTPSSTCLKCVKFTGFLLICWVWNSFSSWSIYSWTCINRYSSTNLSGCLEWRWKTSSSDGIGYFRVQVEFLLQWLVQDYFGCFLLLLAWEFTSSKALLTLAVSIWPSVKPFANIFPFSNFF